MQVLSQLFVASDKPGQGKCWKAEKGLGISLLHYSCTNGINMPTTEIVRIIFFLTRLFSYPDYFSHAECTFPAGKKTVGLELYTTSSA